MSEQAPELPPFLFWLKCGCCVGSEQPVGYLEVGLAIRNHDCATDGPLLLIEDA
jgi:hypothetical protein